MKTSSKILIGIVGLAIGVGIGFIGGDNSDYTDYDYGNYTEYGISHACIGTWSGSHWRNTGQGIKETWSIEINKDGTCFADEVGSGNANYERHYTGEWETVSDNCIEFEMSTGNYTHTMTNSDGVPYTSYTPTDIHFRLYSDGTVTLHDGSSVTMNLNKQ